MAKKTTWISLAPSGAPTDRLLTAHALFGLSRGGLYRLHVTTLTHTHTHDRRAAPRMRSDAGQHGNWSCSRDFSVYHWNNVTSRRIFDADMFKKRNLRSDEWSNCIKSAWYSLNRIAMFIYKLQRPAAIEVAHDGSSPFFSLRSYMGIVVCVVRACQSSQTELWLRHVDFVNTLIRTYTHPEVHSQPTNTHQSG